MLSERASRMGLRKSSDGYAVAAGSLHLLHDVFWCDDLSAGKHELFVPELLQICIPDLHASLLYSIRDAVSETLFQDYMFCLKAESSSLCLGNVHLAVEVCSIRRDRLGDLYDLG